jgi:hypothetical protein
MQNTKCELNNRINQHLQDLTNWKPATKLPELFGNLELTPAQIKHLLWQRDKHPGLASCCTKIGSRLYVNVPMFGLWLGGQLPDQLSAEGVS